MSEDRKWAEGRVKSHLPGSDAAHLDVGKVISILEKGRHVTITDWEEYKRCIKHLKSMKEFLQSDEDTTFRERYIQRRHRPALFAARYWINLDGSLPRFPPTEMLWAIFLRGTTVRRNAWTKTFEKFLEGAGMEAWKTPTQDRSYDEQKWPRSVVFAFDPGALTAEAYQEEVAARARIETELLTADPSRKLNLRSSDPLQLDIILDFEAGLPYADLPSHDPVPPAVPSTASLSEPSTPGESAKTADASRKRPADEDPAEKIHQVKIPRLGSSPESESEAPLPKSLQAPSRSHDKPAGRAAKLKVEKADHSTPAASPKAKSLDDRIQKYTELERKHDALQKDLETLRAEMLTLHTSCLNTAQTSASEASTREEHVRESMVTLEGRVAKIEKDFVTNGTPAQGDELIDMNRKIELLTDQFDQLSARVTHLDKPSSLHPDTKEVLRKLTRQEGAKMEKSVKQDMNRIEKTLEQKLGRMDVLVKDETRRAREIAASCGAREMAHQICEIRSGGKYPEVLDNVLLAAVKGACRRTLEGQKQAADPMGEYSNPEPCGLDSRNGAIVASMYWVPGNGEEELFQIVCGIQGRCLIGRPNLGSMNGSYIRVCNLEDQLDDELWQWGVARSDNGYRRMTLAEYSSAVDSDMAVRTKQ